MASVVYNLYEAKTALSELIERASRGEEIIIAKAGVPMARLTPFGPKYRRPGGWEGKVIIADDFDDELPKDLATAFKGETT